MNHAAFDHETLKQWTDDVDLTASQGFADEWVEAGTVLGEAADTLKQAMIDSETGWTGDAANAVWNASYASPSSSKSRPDSPSG